MGELWPGQEMAARVARAIDWTPLMTGDDPEGTWGWRKPDGSTVLGGTFDPEHSDADALAALDAVLTKHPGWNWMLVHYGKLDAYHFKFMPPEESLVVIDTMCSTIAETLCRAILALAERDKQNE